MEKIWKLSGCFVLVSIFLFFSKGFTQKNVVESLTAQLSITKNIEQYPLLKSNLIVGDTIKKVIPELPLSADPIVNPLTGFHYKSARTGFEMIDRYDRVLWKDIETAKGVYDFSIIERLLESAAENKGVAGFRIRCVTSYMPQLGVPEYLTKEVEKGWWVDLNKDGKKESWVPDWNDPVFLKRVRKLLQALGEKYNDDPRFGFLDIGIYGTFGEWHLGSIGENLEIGAYRASFPTKKHIIDSHIMAFPDKHLLMMSDDTEALRYAMSVSPAIGWRRDSYTNDHFHDVNKDIIKDRWKTAPVIVEPMSARNIDPMKADQVEEYHITAINNINYEHEKYSQQEQEFIRENAKKAGHRYVLKQISYPGIITIDAEFRIDTEWKNSGTAPTYYFWDVCYQLKNTEDGSVIWQGTSSLNLRKVYPGSPVIVSDTFKLPVALESGQYKLSLTVKDPAQSPYFNPMNLAIEIDRKNGSYNLGTITVNNESSPVPAEELPEAVIDKISDTIDNGQYLDLKGWKSISSQGYITNYKWTITSDNHSKTIYGAAVSEFFSLPGDYQISLTVTDNYGQQASQAVALKVKDNVQDENPEFEGLILTPTDDAHVRNGSYANENYGLESGLLIKAGGTNFYRKSFIKFDLNTMKESFQKTILSVYAAKVDANAEVPLSIYTVAHNNWTEQGITWNNAPPAVKKIAEKVIKDDGFWYEFDVTEFVQQALTGDKYISFCLDDQAGTNKMVMLESKELCYKPQMQISYDTVHSSIESRSMDDFRYSTIPNPNSGNFTFRLDSQPPENLVLLLIDSTGQVIVKRSLQPATINQTEQFNLQNLSRGTYFLRIISKNKERTEKIVIF